MNSERADTNKGVVRIIHFVRHAQHEASVDGGELTQLGRKQARCLADYLTRTRVQRIESSDLGRARATALIIASRLEVPRIHTSRTWREILPTAVPDLRVPLKNRQAGKYTLSKLVARLRPTATAREELVVSHGNLIRALVCRILGAPETAWLRMQANHCSVTTIAIDRTGAITVRAFGDTTYLKASLLSNI